MASALRLKQDVRISRIADLGKRPPESARRGRIHACRRTLCNQTADGGGVIDRKWLPLNALRAFEAVGRNLSFTVGAQSLSVTQSAISRHVSSLEDLLGKRLIHRRSSRF